MRHDRNGKLQPKVLQLLEKLSLLNQKEKYLIYLVKWESHIIREFRTKLQQALKSPEVNDDNFIDAFSTSIGLPHYNYCIDWRFLRTNSEYLAFNGGFT